MLTRRKINVVLICLILLSVITVRGQFVEGKEIQRENNNQSVSLSDQEIAEEANKKLRSSFLENQGQVENEEVIFYGSLPNGKIAFGESKVMLWMEGMNSVVTLSFVGAQKVSPLGVNELDTKSNYFLGDRGTYTNVRNFEEILYDELWEGIDLYYQATPKGTKYEFRVAPGANPEDITVRCEGQEELIIGKNSLTILKGKGRFVDEGLKVLQEGMGIKARFVDKGDNTFGFQLSKYNQKKSLIIDPLLYSTFIGGSEGEAGKSIALDSEGNAYVTGYTRSTNFPTTGNANNESYNGARDCFVFKLSTDGSSLIYSTYIGGSNSDSGESITLDNQGNVYVTGGTTSDNFPTTENAYNRTYCDIYDCFVFKLSANGSSLLYSTFVGGNESDAGLSIDLDENENAYVTGSTESTNFPVTIGAYNESHNGAGYWDCFVFKLSANGSKLLYSTFFGGNQHDYGNSIVLDDEGNAYVTGVTASNNFPTTINAYNRTYSGSTECFIFKLSANGSILLYSTFIGGSEGEAGSSITLDNEQNAYVTGSTKSSNFPTTVNAYNRTHGGDGISDCFVFKLSADGSSLLYSTFVGGSSFDSGESITLDNEKNAYVTGGTISRDFPTTMNTYNRTHNGGDCDCFVFMLATDGSSLLYSTYIGGSEDDYGYSIAVSSEGNTCVTGTTYSSDFPTTAFAYNDTYSGADYYGGDCFIFKLLTEEEIPSTPTPTITSGLKYWMIFPLGFVFISTFVIYKKKK